MFRPRAAMWIFVVLVAASGDSRAQSPPLSSVMQEKADNAQHLLKPLVLGDFAGISLYAEQLGQLTYTEVGAWQAHPDSDYLKQANSFVAAVQDLRGAARAMDAPRALSAYTDLISSCANCHKLVRMARSVSLTPVPPILDPLPPHNARR